MGKYNGIDFKIYFPRIVAFKQICDFGNTIIAYSHAEYTTGEN